jgi:hypothetical protein
VNDANDALPLHQFEIDLHQIVMRHVDDAVGTGPRGDRQGEQENQNADGRKFHRADDNWRRQADNPEARSLW